MKKSLEAASGSAVDLYRRFIRRYRARGVEAVGTHVP
jgi:hypothetical protein